MGDVGMIQRGQRLRFPREPRKSRGVVREGLWQDLDRGVAVQLRIARAKALAHAPFTDLRGDFVDAETGAGSEGQVVDTIAVSLARRRSLLGDTAVIIDGL
jgi:hypothetical protein